MTWEMHPAEFENVSKLSPRKRYVYFVKKAADFEELWGLWSDGWAVLVEDGEKLVPVWPHPEFAGAYAAGALAKESWGECIPKLIKLHDWLETWVPEMNANGRKVAVFPGPDGRCTTADPERFKADLELELDQYE